MKYRTVVLTTVAEVPPGIDIALVQSPVVGGAVVFLINNGVTEQLLANPAEPLKAMMISKSYRPGSLSHRPMDVDTSIESPFTKIASILDGLMKEGVPVGGDMVCPSKVTPA